MRSSNDNEPHNGGVAGLRGLRVLVVEDTWLVAKELQSVLEGIGMVVTGPAASLADADRLVAEETPHLAVVDLKLKHEMTFGLIDRMHDRGVPVVVVSGYSAFQSPTEKVAAILQKPFSGAQLLATLHQVMLPEKGYH